MCILIIYISKLSDWLKLIILIYPTIHLLPGINEMIFDATKQLMNVLTAIHGMAATVGSSSVLLNTVTHSPSQKMCIRYMP